MNSLMHAGYGPASKASRSQQKLTACQLGVVLKGGLPGTPRPLVRQMAEHSIIIIAVCT